MRAALPLLLLLAACAPDVRAVYDPARPTHFFDVPFPSDDLVGPDGTPDLTGFPVAEPELAASIETGWIDRIGMTVQGFGDLSAAYFRFEGDVPFPTTTPGTPDDPVVWVALDGSEILPLDLRFVADPLGDPHYGPDTLAVAPQLGHPPKPGGTYVVAVMRSHDVGAPKGWKPTDAQKEALKAAGVHGDVAMATTFTVQDGPDQLRQLVDDADTRLPAWDDVQFRRVVRLEFVKGTTPSGNDATVENVTYEDGGTRTVYLSYDPDEEQVLDLLDWPMAVYEADIDTLNYQDADDRPYMNPSIGHLADVDRMTGWIDFESGALVSEPWTEKMRITVSLPKGPDGEPIAGAKTMIWDHGTAGDAYNIVQRPNVHDDSRALAQAFADAGWATIGRDATLYGTRYPLVDEGFTDGSLGFYNLVNLPAFRDNQRQTAVDGHVLLRYLQDHVNDDLPAGSLDTAHVRRGGHSLGSVTSNLGLAAEPDAYEGAFLVGTGGDFSLYFLETGLLAGQDPETIDLIFGLFGAAVPDEVTTQSIAGAVLGLDAPAWDRIDRLHPLFTLFQTTMDPSDPMAVARAETLPTFIVIAPGDHQTPDFTAEALAIAQPDATVRYCEARSDYDPHQCIWREPEGDDLVREWLDQP